jgi:hypothetical protein
VPTSPTPASGTRASTFDTPRAPRLALRGNLANPIRDATIRRYTAPFRADTEAGAPESTDRRHIVVGR